MTGFEQTRILLSWAIFLQTVELLSLRPHFSKGGVFSWDNLRSEFSIFSVPTQRIFAYFFSHPGFLVLLSLRLISAVLFALTDHFGLNLFLFLSSLLISVRWRGAFNGGSDYMTLVLTGALLPATLFSGVLGLKKAALFYIAIQGIASYSIAGWVKIKNPEWRSGLALTAIGHTPGYNVPEGLARLFSNRRISFIFSWLMMLFEVGFGFLIFFEATRVWTLLAAGAFHLFNVYFLGLNRFFWIWISTYPAIYFLGAEFFNPVQ